MSNVFLLFPALVGFLFTENDEPCYLFPQTHRESDAIVESKDRHAFSALIEIVEQRIFFALCTRPDLNPGSVVGHLKTSSTLQDSNLGPVVYKTTALPTELRVDEILKVLDRFAQIKYIYNILFILTADHKTTTLPTELRTHFPTLL